MKKLTARQRKWLMRILIALVIYVAVILVHQTSAFGDGRMGLLSFVLYAVPYLIAGYDVLLKAFKNIAHGSVFDENFLMAIATVGAIALGEYHEGVEVMLFYQIGEWFQSYAVGKSRKNISDLMDIRPDYANIEQDGQLVQVDPEEVAIGSLITTQINIERMDKLLSTRSDVVEGAEVLEVDREQVEALGAPLYMAPMLSDSSEYARHDPRLLARAIMELWREHGAELVRGRRA